MSRLDESERERKGQKTENAGAETGRQTERGRKSDRERVRVIEQVTLPAGEEGNPARYDDDGPTVRSAGLAD